jgi:hypothetical protein
MITRVSHARRLGGPSAFAACLALVFPSLVMAADANYPLVVTSEQLKKLGIVVGIRSEEKPLENRCYSYGDGGYMMSLSDEVVAHFAKRGFSLPALCMGLAAEIKFNPETGERLPTYVLSGVATADLRKVVEESHSPDDLDKLALTNDLPLDLPDCMKGARFYRDCKLAFDPFKGAKLAPAAAEKQRNNGLEIEAKIAKLIASGGFSRDCNCDELDKDRRAGKFQCRVEREAFCPTQEIQSLNEELKLDRDSIPREDVNALEDQIRLLETCTCKDDVADNWTRCQGSPPECFAKIANSGWLKFEIGTSSDFAPHPSFKGEPTSHSST